MKKILSFFALSILLVSCGGTSNNNVEPPIVDPIDFENVYFDSKDIVYDGTSHILDEVRGAPEGTTITYTGREAYTDVGVYEATALLSKEGYNNKTLNATLKITKADFENITFSDATFDYDGEPHSIYVDGAPSYATVTYTNNGKKSVGVYTVTAKISSPNHNTLTKTAILTILGQDITGVTFSDKSFEYDGKSHSLEVEGELPEGVSVSYTNNGKTDSGTYKVTAKLTGEGYNPLELTANLTITPAKLNKPGYFSDKSFIYDGKNHSLVVDGAPSGATVTYRCLNASGTNTFKEPGVYEIEATVKLNKNYASVLTATLFIVEEATIGVDSSKTPLKIDENLKWDELHEALDHDNFTYDYLSGYYDVENIDDPYPSDIFSWDRKEHQYRLHFVTNGIEAYSHGYSTYDEPYHTYKFYKVVGDDILDLYFHEDGSYTDYEKFPKAAFSETVCKPDAANALVALTKGEDGGFLIGVDGDDYYMDNGYPFIEEGKFTVLMQHPRTLDSGYRYFYEIYEFYNIGNSLVELPDKLTPSSSFMKDSCPIGDYRLGGVKYRYSAYGSYSNMKYYYSAELYVSYATKIFLKPGTYIVNPYIYDNPVRAIVHYSYYNQYYNYNQSGYTFNLYIDKDRYYQGEYSELGSISRLDISEVTSHGGIVNYYEDWNA